jgi:DNA-binding transcriptional regulator YdaS (Cro superfamily)
MQKPQTAFGARITSWLEGKGLNPFRAQEVLGATDTTIKNWIGGIVLPPSTRIPALASALGLSVDELRSLVERDRKARRRRSLARVVRGSHAKHSTKPVRA